MSGGLTTQEIADMQAAIRELTLSDTADEATLTGSGQVSDGMGGTIDGDGVTTGPYAVRIAPMGNSAAEKAVADRLAGRIGWTLTFEAGTPVENDQTITVGARRFEVIGVLGPRSVELERRVVCVEV